MRLVFLGTPSAAVPALRAVVADGHDVALVVSRADARRSRGGAAQPSPVKAAALEMGLPVTDRVGDVVGTGAELGVVVAYGRLIRPEVLAELAMCNVHFSLLPRWRGAAPVERAILAGDAVTGVCLMALEETLDTGPVYRRAEVAIGADETAGELRDRLAQLGARLLSDALRQGLGEPVAQEGEPTYAAKLDPSELRLDWSDTAAQLQRVVRVGRAWTTFRGRRLLVLGAALSTGAAAEVAPGTLDATEVATGAGGLQLRLVQPEGRRPLPAAEWVRGVRPSPGERLGEW